MGEVTPEAKHNLLTGVMLEDGSAKFETMRWVVKVLTAGMKS